MSSTRPRFPNLPSKPQNPSLLKTARRLITRQSPTPSDCARPRIPVGSPPGSSTTETLNSRPAPMPSSLRQPAGDRVALMGDGSLSGAIHPNLHSPEDVFRQHRGRRAGIVKALTQDVEVFYELCNPEEKALCLLGQPNGTWEVSLPLEEVPAALPEPVCGINFARDGTPKKLWLYLVAIHSDAWLMSMAFYHAGRVAFDRHDREQLFEMINTLPTVYEAVKGSYKRQAQTTKAGSQPPKQNNSNSKMVKWTLPMLDEENNTNFNSKPVNCAWPVLEEEDGANAGGGSEDQAMTKCAACEETYSADDGHLWIGCDHCERWFHGKCVGITPEKAEEIEQYMCPGCSYRSKQNKMKASY